MSVVLRKRKLKSGKESFVLDINDNGKRWTENLKGLELVPELIVSESATAKERKSIEAKNKEISKLNKDTEQTANNCLTLRNSELILSANGLQPKQRTEYFEKHYLEFLNTKSNANTYQVYLVLFESLKRYYPNFKALTLKQIDRSFLRGYMKFLTDNKVNSNSQRLYLDRIRHFFNYLKKEKIISENPISEIDLPKVRTHQRQYLTIEEIQQLAKNSDGINPTVKDMFLFACFTGLRISDLYRLRWSDIRDGEYFSIRVQKTQKLLTLKLPTPAKEILNGIQRNNESVFKRYSQHTIQYHIAKWIKQNNIEKHISIHGARHSFAVNYLSAGGDIYILSKLLGHGNLKTTQIYADVINIKLDKAMELFDGIEI